MICQLWSKPEIDIPHDETHIFFSWKGCVFFSATRRGDALDCHVAAKGKNKLLLREAIGHFCRYAMFTYPWCSKVSACVKLKSVENLCLKCGFTEVGMIGECKVMIWVK